MILREGNCSIFGFQPKCRKSRTVFPVSDAQGPIGSPLYFGGDRSASWRRAPKRSNRRFEERKALSRTGDTARKSGSWMGNLRLKLRKQEWQNTVGDYKTGSMELTSSIFSFGTFIKINFAFTTHPTDSPLYRVIRQLSKKSHRHICGACSVPLFCSSAHQST